MSRIFTENVFLLALSTSIAGGLLASFALYRASKLGERPLWIVALALFSVTLPMSSAGMTSWATRGWLDGSTDFGVGGSVGAIFKRAFVSQLNGMAIVSCALPLTCGFAGLAVALVLWSRVEDKDWRVLTASVVGPMGGSLVVTVLAAGGLLYYLQVTTAVAKTVTVDVAARHVAVSAALEAARSLVLLCAAVAGGIFIITAGVVFGLLKLAGSRGESQPVEHSAAASRFFLATLIVGAIFCLLAWPLFRENRSPRLPALDAPHILDHRGAGGTIRDRNPSEPLPTPLSLPLRPDARVPDELPRDPLPHGAILVLEKDALMLNGAALSFGDLGMRVTAERQLRALLEKSSTSRTALGGLDHYVLIAPDDLASDRLVRLLWTLLDAKITEITLAFVARDRVARPFLGTFSLVREGGARVHLEAEGDLHSKGAARGETTVVRVESGLAYGDIARQVAAARRVGGTVVLTFAEPRFTGP